jgi:hypothetical protein
MVKAEALIILLLKDFSELSNRVIFTFQIINPPTKQSNNYA